ncbi:MAG: hypothetical protein IJ242_17725 [Clostridia bacterium]|nr:hypothetical protein [Clostridia bacterium]
MSLFGHIAPIPVSGSALVMSERVLRIENLGSGTADVLVKLLGAGEALQMYGSVMNPDFSEMRQVLLLKFVSGDALQLYRNEISGIDEFDWKAFPEAHIAADGKLSCDIVDDRITEVKELLDIIK